MTFVSAEFVISAVVTGIDNSSIMPISIYPNPINGELHIETDDDYIQSIKIFDFSGQLLIEKTDLDKNSRIDLSSYKAGLYIINIQTERELITQKIRKN